MGDNDVCATEVVAAFAAYLAERASSGVQIAKAVSGVGFSGGVVQITFDPAASRVDWELLMDLSPFQNLAEFPGTVVAFKNEEGKRLRTVVDRIDLALPDGTALGSITAAEAYKMGTGGAWSPGE